MPKTQGKRETPAPGGPNPGPYNVIYPLRILTL